MNERIQELKEQAMEWVPNMADPDTKIRLLNAGKFAELIVKECIEINKQELAFNAFERLLNRYQEHFGVEE